MKIKGKTRGKVKILRSFLRPLFSFLTFPFYPTHMSQPEQRDTYSLGDIHIKSTLLHSIELNTGASYGRLGSGAFPDFTVKTRTRFWLDPSNTPDWLLGYAPRPEGAGVRPKTARRTVLKVR